MEELRQFIEYAADQPDVWFVTTQQVGRRSVAGMWQWRLWSKWLHQLPCNCRMPVHNVPCLLLPSACLHRRCCHWLSAPSLQLLAWMDNPVPASRVAHQLKCEKPTDIKADNVCETYVG